MQILLQGANLAMARVAVHPQESVIVSYVVHRLREPSSRWYLEERVSIVMQ